MGVPPTLALKLHETALPGLIPFAICLVATPSDKPSGLARSSVCVGWVRRTSESWEVPRRQNRGTELSHSDTGARRIFDIEGIQPIHCTPPSIDSSSLVAGQTCFIHFGNHLAHSQYRVNYDIERMRSKLARWEQGNLYISPAGRSMCQAILPSLGLVSAVIVLNSHRSSCLILASS